MSRKTGQLHLKRWKALSLFARSGDVPIDNNAVENAIRPIAIGKKNWLFAGSERAGCRAASIQSLLATAKLNDIEPAAWLKETLEKLPTWPYIAASMNCYLYAVLQLNIPPHQNHLLHNLRFSV